MEDIAFGATIRAARIRRSWRQVDLAAAARVSRTTVGRVELGHLDELTLRAVRRVAHALDIQVGLLPRSRSAAVERITSARHSALAEHVARWLARRPGWIARPEVSFSIWGERGVVDLFAWHAATRSLIVIELKTAIVDVGEILGTLDRKVRLAREIVAALDWEPASVSICLIVAEGRTNHRRVGEHSRTFRAALPDDGRRLGAWLRSPTGTVRALTFMPDDRPRGTRSGFATAARVSTRTASSTRAGSRSITVGARSIAGHPSPAAGPAPSRCRPVG